MGYNNNHAGMHLIWHRRYGMYDDLRYYDRLAEEENNRKKLELKIENKCKDKVTEKVNKSMDKEKNNKNKTKPNNSKATYGNEILNDIDVQYYAGFPQSVMANIMIIALKNKKDIYAILEECEELMKKDKRTNPAPDYMFGTSKLESTLVFLSMLADKLNCCTFEFFIEDEKYRRNYVYGLISELMKSEMLMQCIDGYIEESGVASFSIHNFDYHYEMTERFSRPTEPNMTLEFIKEIFEDGTVNYAIGFGSLNINTNTKYNYCNKGAYLLEEESGVLAYYIEDMIKAHPEWKD